ncbi:MAG: pantoate--beta-alanine ligase [Candidatus Margulisbacteria bacterium]|nr:pantoate--beta-alanine ligase [Candidatus Margulisiibacteriota bacterium]
MQIFYTPKEIQSHLKIFTNKQVGFVPTMGALHEGHLSLIQKSQQENDITIVSIFVNPTQFSPTEDLNKYPRPLENDIRLLKKNNVDILFTPNQDDIYLNGLKNATQLYIPKLSKQFCGQTRRHFFRGILMLVNRLFNIIQAQKAYFGEKDFQQLQLIQKMTHDLFMPIEIIGCPIVRESNGLAMSSRNQYLTPEEKEIASNIYRALKKGQSQFQKGLRSPKELIETIMHVLQNTPDLHIDYLDIVHNNLSLAKSAQKTDRIIFAGFIGKTRLLDNVQLGL